MSHVHTYTYDNISAIILVGNTKVTDFHSRVSLYEGFLIAVLIFWWIDCTFPSMCLHKKIPS